MFKTLNHKNGVAVALMLQDFYAKVSGEISVTFSTILCPLKLL
jgi:hypothetical protein